MILLTKVYDIFIETERFEKLDQFFSRFKKVIFKKGETILRVGDEPRGVYFLKKGYVRLYSISEDAKELTLIIFKREDFVKFIKENSDVLFELMGRILMRLGGLLTRMEYMIFGNAYNKVASIISICAERFGSAEKLGVMIGLPLTHKDIANLIGVARETVSIEIKRLENERIIGFRSKYIVVKDVNKLRKKAMLSS